MALTIHAWIVGGAIAALCGAMLSVAFRLPAVIVASIAAAVAGAMFAQNAEDAIFVKFAFVVFLLAVLQAAYLTGALIRARSRK